MGVHSAAELQIERKLMPNAATYRAFISYSHESDLALAAALQSSLSQFAKPWYRLRSMRIFRDKTGLSANPALWQSIEDALSESEYFLFLASPASASSPWVQKEVEWWLKNRSSEKLLIALTAGEILWSGQDFDWQKTTAVPACLKGAFKSEPLYADFRALKADGKYRNSDLAYRSTLLDVASPLLGRPKGDLDSEDLRLHRRAERISFAAVFLLILLITFSSVAWYAADQRQQIASSRALAAASSQAGDPALGILLALEAHRISDTVESRSALLSRLQEVRHVNAFLWGHTDGVTRAIYSPDGTTILSAGWDNQIILYNAATYAMLGKRIATPKGLVGVAIKEDGSQFASANQDLVGVWDTATQKMIGSPLSYPGEEFEHVGFSPDGKLLAASTAAYGGHPSKVIVWDLASRRVIASPEGHCFAFSPDNSLLAICYYTDLRFFDLRTRKLLKQTLPGHSKNISAIAFSQDGTTVATGSEDQTIFLWDVKAQKLLHKFSGHSDVVSALLFDPNGKILFSGDQKGTMLQWDLQQMKGTGKATLNPDTTISSFFIDDAGRLKALALAQDVVMSVNLDDNPALGHRIQATDAHSANIAFSPDGRYVATSGEFGQISEWDTASGKPNGQPYSSHEKQVSALAYCPDGKTLISGAMDGTVAFWDATTHQALSAPVKVHRSPVWSVACSPDSKTAASGSDAELIWWDVASRKVLGPPVTAQKDRIWTLRFSPDGEFLAAAGNSHDVAIWKSRSQWQPERTLSSGADNTQEITPVGLSFSSDGTLLAASAAKNNVAIWDFKSGKLVQPLLSGHTQSVSSVSFSRDGKILASGSQDGDIRLWDASTHQLIGTLRGIPSPVDSIAFSSTDGTLAALSEDDGITFWQADYESWAKRACQIANRNMTQEEWQNYFGKKSYRKICSDR
jgi:WD40 repeat protein